jgi:hypothetical protein
MLAMIPYQNEKIENAICFFANGHTHKTGKPLYQTFLYKYLAFLDFKSLEVTGQPSLGLTYIAMERGPVPKELFEKRDNFETDLFVFQTNKEGQTIVKCKSSKPDLDYFSKFEIDVMKMLIEIYATTYLNTKMMSDASHEAIKAWRTTWSNKKNSIIDPSSTFSDNIFEKSEEELTHPEENFLIYKALGGK